MKEEIAFEKYRKRGAYHWEIFFGSLFNIDCFLRGRYQMVIHLLNRAGIQPSDSLLEVGCGDGALSGLIAKTFGCRVTGTDPSAEGIRFSQEMFKKHRLEGSFLVTEGYHLPYPDGTFDVIVLADVIEHLQNPGAMLTELKRLIKESGHIIITTPIRSSEHPEDKMHVQEFFPDQLIGLCEPFFGSPSERILSHPVVWYELYTYGQKFTRSLIRLYCRLADKIFGQNVFFRPGSKPHWKNFKQQGLLFSNVRRRNS